MRLEYLRGKDRCQIEVFLRYCSRDEKKELLFEALLALNEARERQDKAENETLRLQRDYDFVQRKYEELWDETRKLREA